ncbi:MAG: 6-phosphogluconolactonase [Pseudomonadota bacterium]
MLSYPDRDMLAIDLANQLLDDLSAALDRQDRVGFAVPGGKTPGPVFDMLSNASLDWARVDLWLTDERWVPEDHPRSNAALVRARLLTGKASQARFTGFYTHGTDPDAAAATLSVEIMSSLPLSVVLLGMGADMHTASLFPRTPGLEEALAPHAPPVMAMDPAGQADARISLSAPVLTGADACHLMIAGDDKRAALERAEHADPLEAPVRAVLDAALVHWSP